MAHDEERTRQSWNIATRNHNAHKGDQAARLRQGEELLFEEELELLGPLAGKSLVHLQCNSGQDSLCLARRGAAVTGVDWSDEAIAFARRLSADSGIAAEFVQSEVVQWLSRTDARFDVAFASYGVTGWLPDLSPWARGVHRVLKPGGRFVYVEYHPLVWSLGDDLRATRDDYFADGPFIEPVSDYVASSGAALGAVEPSTATVVNDVPAQSWQHTLADVLDSLLRAGLHFEAVREYPHANGCRVHPALVPAPGRRWVWPPGVARTPLMFAVAARRP